MSLGGGGTLCDHKQYSTVTITCSAFVIYVYVAFPIARLMIERCFIYMLSGCRESPPVAGIPARHRRGAAPLVRCATHQAGWLGMLLAISLGWSECLRSRSINWERSTLALSDVRSGPEAAS